MLLYKTFIFFSPLFFWQSKNLIWGAIPIEHSNGDIQSTPSHHRSIRWGGPPYPSTQHLSMWPKCVDCILPFRDCGWEANRRLGLPHSIYKDSNMSRLSLQNVSNCVSCTGIFGTPLGHVLSLSLVLSLILSLHVLLMTSVSVVACN